MFNISTYLDKFKTIGLGDIQAKEAVLLVLKDQLKVTLTRKDLKIRDGVVYIQANPIIKNQIYIKKTAFLAAVSQKTDKVKDVR
jgi:hypothetical protein